MGNRQSHLEWFPLVSAAAHPKERPQPWWAITHVCKRTATSLTLHMPRATSDLRFQLLRLENVNFYVRSVLFIICGLAVECASFKVNSCRGNSER